MVSLLKFYRILDKKRAKKELVNLRVVFPECVIVANEHTVVAGMLIVEGQVPVQILTAQIFLTGETQRLQYSADPNHPRKSRDRLLLRDSHNHLFMQQDLDIPTPAKSLTIPFSFLLPKDSPSSFRIGNSTTQYKVIANLSLNAHPREISIEKTFQVIHRLSRISEPAPRLTPLPFNWRQSLGSPNLCLASPSQ
ncbi:hypothetical protein DSO57_1012143 [Entomophthora muscae]|uniref:Uncharacterized protein n=1 Tax=Entomophthora muscae TaxID=34485 RepID=A0ACC2U4L8_9FUNG|nr:hypothetical protein DSO57_1012143 [Entomophthora muscae]